MPITSTVKIVQKKTRVKYRNSGLTTQTSIFKGQDLSLCSKSELIAVTLIPLLRIPSLCRIGSTKLVLPKWQNIDILNRGIRVHSLFSAVAPALLAFRVISKPRKKDRGIPAISTVEIVHAYSRSTTGIQGWLPRPQFLRNTNKRLAWNLHIWRSNIVNRTRPIKIRSNYQNKLTKNQMKFLTAFPICRE